MSGRNIGVAIDFSSCSRAALRWASTNLAKSGDRLILIHVSSTCHSEEGAIQLWEHEGSPFIPLIEFSDPHVTKMYGVSPDQDTLQLLVQVASQRKAEVVAKIYWGDPTKKICEAVERIPLHCLVVGSRGLSTIKRTLLGSVSTYVVHHATCPVIVVKDK